jgi:hypothetical protein
MSQELISGAPASRRSQVFAWLMLAQVLGCSSSPAPEGMGTLPASNGGTPSTATGGATAPKPAAGSGSVVTSGAAGGGAPGSAGKPATAAAGTSSPATAGTGGSIIAAGSGGTTGAAGADASAAGAGPGDMTTGMHAYLDPGKDPWVKVPEADLMTVCKLDVSKLKAAETSANYPWAVFRYGKQCYQHGADGFAPAEAWSTTKSLGALVTGIASYQTRMIPKTGKKTGQLLDSDMATDWLDSVSYNQMAKVAHVLGMVAHDTDLSLGKKSFAYDTVGTTEINTLGNMITTAISQDSMRLGTTVSAFTQKFLYEPLGMKNSMWDGAVFAYSWTVDLYDMARVGVLINNYGMWAGERIVAEEWIYRQTHPSWEDANTGFGYLTWLNSGSNWESISGGKQDMAGTPGTCAPLAINKVYPHGVSDSPNCNYNPPQTCDQKYDVGVWNAEGLMGQLIQGHRGLDLVIVARNAQPGGTGPGTAKQVWDAIRPAVIAGDPMYKGDEASFCKDYGGNNYAPDLK